MAPGLYWLSTALATGTHCLLAGKSAPKFFVLHRLGGQGLLNQHLFWNVDTVLLPWNMKMSLMTG